MKPLTLVPGVTPEVILRTLLEVTVWGVQMGALAVPALLTVQLVLQASFWKQQHA